MRKTFFVTIIALIIAISGSTSVFGAAKRYGVEKKCLETNCNGTAYNNQYYCKKHKCESYGCTRKKGNGSSYCFDHNPNKKHSLYRTTTNTGSYTSYSSSKSTSNSKGTNSYDQGYEDVWLDDDYDWDRYYKDDDYARGVDDAMDDEDW